MTDRLTQAKQTRERSRERLRTTIATIAARFDPNRLIAEGSDRAKAAIAATPSRVVEAARERPAAAAGIISGLALLLFRKPIFGAVKRLTEEKDDG